MGTYEALLVEVAEELDVPLMSVEGGVHFVKSDRECSLLVHKDANSPRRAVDRSVRIVLDNGCTGSCGSSIATDSNCSRSCWAKTGAVVMEEGAGEVVDEELEVEAMEVAKDWIMLVRGVSLVVRSAAVYGVDNAGVKVHGGTSASGVELEEDNERVDVVSGNDESRRRAIAASRRAASALRNETTASRRRRIPCSCRFCFISNAWSNRSVRIDAGLVCVVVGFCDLSPSSFSSVTAIV